MTDGTGEELGIMSSDQELLAKHKKVRKGTRSCWECKRRKIRCIYPSLGGITCVSCQRRRLPCVSQDLPESLSPSKKGNRHLGERIARVEDVMKDLLAGKEIGATSNFREEPHQDVRRSHSDGVKTRTDCPTSFSVRAPPTPIETPEQYTSRPLLPNSDSSGKQGHVEAETAPIQLLWAAFPADHDIRTLLQESPRLSRYTDLIVTQPHRKMTLEALGAPYLEAQLPGPKTHPVMLARFMLMFAVTLQTPMGEGFSELSVPPTVLSRRLVTAAMTWLASNEEVQGTVEGLICIMLEAVFETNCGNLRRAWIIYRRAMTTAQMMGLHRSIMPPLKRVAPSLDVDPGFMWFRIVYMDRYLSLLLGLPQGTLDKSMTAEAILQHEPPLGQFERRLTVIASRILERNESASPMSERVETQSIDRELLKLSESMPANFWWPASFGNLKIGSPEYLLETIRLAAQVYHFGLLIQLHLPYMMCGTGDKTKHEYSRITCVNAGREIITRFIAHRSFNPKSSCARPVDFFALLAAMTLLLAHLDAHHHKGVPNPLAHQRLSDRALLSRALDVMDGVGKDNKDVIMEQSARLIQRLLDIEADAAEGSERIDGSGRMDADDIQRNTQDEGEDLRFHFPYLEIIKIARRGPISRESMMANASSQTQQLSQAEFSQREPSTTECVDTFTEMPDVGPSNENQFFSCRGDTVQRPGLSGDLRTMDQLDAQPRTLGYNEQYAVQYTDSDLDIINMHSDVEPSNITAGIDEWIFQGVDLAFFDNLMRGTSGANDVESEQMMS